MIDSNFKPQSTSFRRFAVLLIVVSVSALVASEGDEAAKPSDSKMVAPYLLRDGEALKRVFPVTKDARLPYIKKMNFPDGVQLMGGGKITIAFAFDKGEPSPVQTTYGNDLTLAGILEVAAKIEPCELDGDRTVWATRLPGDIVFRSKATVEQTLESLQKILADELNLDVRFEVENLDRIVFIATGEFDRRFDDEFDKNNIQICGDNKKSIMTRIGTFEEFLGSISYRIGRRIVSDVRNRPKDNFSWSIAIDGSSAEYWKEVPPNDIFTADAELVLENVSRQTGLTFKKTKRNVRIIRADRIDKRNINND
jgi:hypothetical protein